MKKPVFEVIDQVRHKPACSTMKISWRLDILDIETRDIILYHMTSLLFSG